MSERSKDWAIAFCGLNCAKCDMYEAAHGNVRLMEEIVNWFKEERKKTIKPKQIKCEQCRGPLGVHWSPSCRIMLCAKKKEIQYCFQCKEFPCSILNALSSDDVSHHKKTVENLHRMKRIGLDTWIAEQEKNGKCSFCP